MKKNTDHIRIYCPGGVVSAAALREITVTGFYLGSPYLQLGLRQDIVFPLADKEAQNRLRQENCLAQIPKNFKGDDQPNIVSSLPAAEIFPSTDWIAPGVYHEILNLFDFRPKLKVNLIDPKQDLICHFTGDINFLASTVPNYWYLYWRRPGQDPLNRWPSLISGNKIADVVKNLETILNAQPNCAAEEVFNYVQENIKSGAFPPKFWPEIRGAPVPVYEGFYEREGKYWFGLYQKENKYSCDLLENLCLLCQRTNITTVAITSWGSLLFKNIAPTEISKWRD